VRAALEQGMDLEEFAPRLSFFFACHNDILEEVAKFRAARRLWAHVMREEFKATQPKSWMLRFHTQTGGSTLTAQQPEVNIVRTAYQALAAVLGGTQSLHTNAFDEALGLPTQHSATLALRTQQVLAYESGVTNEADPLGGSVYVEGLTDKLEEDAKHIMAQIEALGGSIAAIEAGFIQNEIEDAAYRFQRSIENNERIVVGVNKFQTSETTLTPIQKIDAEVDSTRAAALRTYRETRDGAVTDAALGAVRVAARGSENLMGVVMNAFRAKATLGEICGVLRQEWGEYEPVQ
jgi:methylmalonyl-CoA mutase, N-terminal domain